MGRSGHAADPSASSAPLPTRRRTADARTSAAVQGLPGLATGPRRQRRCDPATAGQLRRAPGLRVAARGGRGQA